jgi:hypothetical protein
MNFQISGLPVAPFAPLFGQPDHELARRGIFRHTADRTLGFPCRVSLRDAEPGETLLLLNYEHLPVASPYRSSHAIYVREFAVEARPAVDEVPEVLRRRMLSIRGFDKEGMMRDADVVDGQEVASAIVRIFGNPEIDFIHLHNAKPGCFAARVDRA